MTRRSYARGFARIAKEHSEWAGLPVPLMGERLTMEKSYFGADKLDVLNPLFDPPADTFRACKIDDDSECTTLRNTFWSQRLRSDVMIWQEGKRFTWGRVPGVHHLDFDIRTLGCADAWSLETEQTALETLRTLTTHQQFRQYLLTGSFLETSKRSGIFYMFRRLRPTVAMSGASGTMKILVCLCLHPIGYYQNSWAGAMTPSDDVLSHLMLCRGDEKMFWRRSNQHSPLRPEAGL